MSDSDAYPDLDDSDIAVFRALGTARQVDRGEYLYRAGDVTYDFFVLVGAQVDVFVRVDGEERILVHHGPGRFLGELNMVTGLRAFISARVTDPGEVITVSRDRLHRLMATDPRLADIILAAFLSRRNLLLEGGAPAIRVVGSRYSPESLRVREFLVRTRIPHEWIDSDSDLHLETLLQQFS